MSRVRSAAGVILAWALASMPRAAVACAVCVSGLGDQSTGAFRFTTLLLSLLPLSMFGGGIFWLRRRMRQLEPRTPAAPARVSAAR